MSLCNNHSTMGKGIHQPSLDLITSMQSAGSIHSIHGIELPFCFRLNFSHFHLHHPLQVPLFDNGELHSLACFGPHSWHVNGWFHSFKLTTLTCPSVADILFTFSHFWPPCSSHYLQQLTAFVNILQTLFFVCGHLIWPVQINSNDLYYHCRFYFCFSPIPPAGPTVQPWVRSVISILWNLSLVCKAFF